MPIANEKRNSKKFPYAMLREIYEQPAAIQRALQQHVRDELLFHPALSSIEASLSTFKKIIVAASGSSRHAGLAGEIMIEDLSGVPVDVEYASEYCYRSTHAGADPLVVVITQSGETADTVAAQREAAARGAKSLAICNVADSTITREASASLLTCAGPEKAVPATKSFTAQLTVLHLFALFLARKRGRMTSEVIRTHVANLQKVPELIEECLPAWDRAAKEVATLVREVKTYLYLGRGVHYAIAREAALKLKEISYAHAEGYPAGELKHGPNALVDRHLPLVVLATCDDNDPDSVLRYRKTLGTMEEVKNRGGRVIAVVTAGHRIPKGMADLSIEVPVVPELLAPILEIIPLQLMAYHVGVLNGCDVDNPRNLVKAVVRE